MRSTMLQKGLFVLVVSILFLIAFNVASEAAIKSKRTLPRKPTRMNSRSVSREDRRYLEYREVLARTINTEGRNQPYKGQLAIGQTLVNRYLEGYRGDMRKIAYDWYNGTRGKKYQLQTPTKENYKAAEAILNGYRVFPGTNVKYYYSNLFISKRAKKKFLVTMKPVATIGNHVFCVARKK